jgi:hypothetical protein
MGILLMPIANLITELQIAIANNGMTAERVIAATRELAELGWEYDDERYPPLADTEAFSDAGEAPSNLAEALLWKLGRWQKYQDFAAYYANQDLEPQPTDVVFFAFARHLRDNNNPIYDQHVMRALWAICGGFTDDEKTMCRMLLFNERDEWKPMASGRHTIQCYELYVRHINALVNIPDGPTRGQIDRLLMPLGRALKELTDSYATFQQLCGWQADDKRRAKVTECDQR